MSNKGLIRFAAAVGLCLALAGLQGCLIAGSTRTTTSGTRVPASTFDQIKTGATTIGWVNATLGEPSSKLKNGDDEVWKYVYTEHTDSSGAVFLIFAGESSNEKTNTVFIEFKDGVVINKWRA